MQSDLISIEQLIKSHAAEMQPLSLNVASSPAKSHDDTDVDEDSSIHESTPIKPQSQSVASRASNGLLAYSTPVVAPFASLTNSQKSAARKPRVNFHSIDDIVNSVVSKDENNDSGFANMSQSVNSTPSMTSYNSPSLMAYYNTSQAVQQQQQQEELVSASNQDSDEISESHSGSNSVGKSADASEKKVRTTFTDHQKKMLDLFFKKNPYPDPRETEELSQQLVLPENVIKVWFQNKRSRDKQRKFSNKNAAKLQSMQLQQSQATAFSSPILANLHLLSKMNGFNAVNNASQMLALYTQSLLN